MDNQTKTNALPDIRVTSVMRAPISKVWSAVATSEGLAAWFMPNDFQPVVGHEFHLNAGPYGMAPCKVTEVDPPRRLSFQWTEDWTVTFELVEKDGQTEVTLTHSGWEAGKRTAFGQPHEAIRDNMAGGWTGLVQKLGAYVGG